MKKVKGTSPHQYTVSGQVTVIQKNIGNPSERKELLFPSVDINSQWGKRTEVEPVLWPRTMSVETR